MNIAMKQSVDKWKIAMFEKNILHIVEINLFADNLVFDFSDFLEPGFESFKLTTPHATSKSLMTSSPTIHNSQKNIRYMYMIFSVVKNKNKPNANTNALLVI